MGPEAPPRDGGGGIPRLKVDSRGMDPGDDEGGSWLGGGTRPLTPPPPPLLSVPCLPSSQWGWGLDPRGAMEAIDP